MAISEEQLQVNIQKAKQLNYSDAEIAKFVNAMEAQGMIERPGFVRSVASAFTRPAVDYAALVGEAGNQAISSLINRGSQSKVDELVRRQQEIVTDDTIPTEQKSKMIEALDEEIKSGSGRIQQRAGPTFMTSPKRQFAFENITSEDKTGAERLGAGAAYGGRKGAGAASYFVPVGGGGAGTALGRVATATGTGALAGGLRTLGEDYSTGEDVAKGAAAGGITGGVLQTAGEAYRALRYGGTGNKTLEKAGTSLRNSAKRKRLNKVSVKKYGGTKFFDNLDDAGLGNFKDPEDLAEQAKVTIQQNMDELNKGFAGMDTKFDRTEVIKMLDDEIAKRPLASDRAPFEAVKKEVLESTGGRWVDPQDYLTLRRSAGGMGKWRPGSDVSTGKAGAFEEVYKVMNDQIEKKLATKGFESFRQNNKAVSTGINAVRVADEAMRKVGAEPLNMYDYIVGAGGLATGDPLTGGLAMAGRRVLTSPTAMDVTGKGLINLSRGGGVPNMAQPVLNLGSDVTGRSLMQAARSAIPSTVGAMSIDNSGSLELSPEGQALSRMAINGTATPQAINAFTSVSGVPQAGGPQFGGGADYLRSASMSDAFRAAGYLPQLPEKDQEEMLNRMRAQQFKESMLNVALELQDSGADRIAGGSGLAYEALTLGNRVPSKYGDTKAKYEQLRSMLSLENRQMLKGSGTISNFEADMLAQAATALRPNMTDQAFNAELQKVIGILSGQMAQQ